MVKRRSERWYAAQALDFANRAAVQGDVVERDKHLKIARKAVSSTGLGFPSVYTMLEAHGYGYSRSESSSDGDAETSAMRDSYDATDNRCYARVSARAICCGTWLNQGVRPGISHYSMQGEVIPLLAISLFVKRQSTQSPCLYCT